MVHILEAAKQTNVERVIFASTEWVYSGCKGNDMHENSPFYMPGAGHIYTSTKIAGEFFCHDYQKLFGQDFTIMRYGIPYGPRARSGTVIPIFISLTILAENLSVFPLISKIFSASFFACGNIGLVLENHHVDAV